MLKHKLSIETNGVDHFNRVLDIFGLESRLLWNCVSGRIYYTRDQLLAWNSPSLLSGQYSLSHLPGGILWRENSNSTPVDNAGKVKKRKRGKKGGVRQRLRRKQLTCIPLPSMILGNVHTLRNKLDELQGNVRSLQDYRNSCVIALTESWLTEEVLDNDLCIDGFGIPFSLGQECRNHSLIPRRGCVPLCQQELLYCGDYSGENLYTQY